MCVRACVCVFDNYCKKSRPNLKESLMGEVHGKNYVIILILNINIYVYTLVDIYVLLFLDCIKFAAI